nr:uncharacterized protein LOC119178633 [Rhipicephalus microplus]
MKLLHLHASFLLMISALSAADGSCNESDTLFDIGLVKALSRPSFDAFPLPYIRRTFRKAIDFEVSLSQGKLYGLASLRLFSHSYINATENGITASFGIDGGPLEVTYTGTIRSVLLHSQVLLSVHIPRIELFIKAHEGILNNLHVDYVISRASSVTFRANQLNESNLVVEFITFITRHRFEEEIKNKINGVISAAVHHFLGQVELFVRNGTIIEEIKSPRDDPSYIPGIVLPGRGGICYSDYPLGPYGSGIFDCSIWRMTMASKLDPLVLSDVDDITWGGMLFHITNVTVRGLSSLRQRGDNYAVTNQCGMSARVALTFKNIRVRLYANMGFLAQRLQMDVRIVGVDVVLQVKEIDQALEIEDYQLNFTQPLEYDVHVLTPGIREVVDASRVLMGKQLTEEQTNKLEDHSRKYLERAIGTVTEFIKDPAPWMPWNHSIIDAYRKYLEQRQE